VRITEPIDFWTGGFGQTIYDGAYGTVVLIDNPRTEIEDFVGPEITAVDVLLDRKFECLEGYENKLSFTYEDVEWLRCQGVAIVHALEDATCVRGANDDK